MKNGESFSARSAFLLVLILTAGILCTASMICNCILKRDILLEKCRKIAWRTGTVPAVRGRILDKKGNILARTKVCYGLRFAAVPENPERTRQILRKIPHLPGRRIGNSYPDRGIILKNLSPEECRRLRKLLKTCPELRLFPQFQRVYACPEEEGTAGISGMEKKYNSVLAGTPGRFAVMLDRRGDWVPGTVRIIDEPVHGNDVTVNPEEEVSAP